MRNLAIALLSVLFTAVLAASTQAETVVEKVARTGVLTAGTRTDTLPFGYINSRQQWVGYSIDMLHLIQQQLEQQLGREIQLNLVPVTIEDWISKVQTAQVDLVCSSTTITQRRSRDVAFSVPYFRTGTQFLVDVARRPFPGEFRVGVIPRTTSNEVVKTYLQLARFVNVPDRATGLRALQEGRIDALASDGILLEGMRQTLDRPENYQVIPSRPYQPEIYGCMLPREDTSLQALVNQTLIEFMQRVLNHDPQALATVDAWFGDSGVTPVNRDQLFAFFQETIAAYQSSSSPAEPAPNP